MNFGRKGKGILVERENKKDFHGKEKGKGFWWKRRIKKDFRGKEKGFFFGGK